MSYLEIEKPFTMIIAGHTMCGKTHLMKDILKKVFNDFDAIFILSKTLNLNGDFNEFEENFDISEPPLLYKYDNNFKQVTQKIVDEAEKLVLKDKDDAPDILIIYEDQANTSLTQFKGILDTFSLLSRHYKISMIVTTQRITAIGKTIRLNAKYFILFNCSNFSELEKFVEENVSKFTRKRLYRAIDEIFHKKYSYIFVKNFHPIPNERLLINGKVPMNDFLDDFEARHSHELSDLDRKRLENRKNNSNNNKKTKIEIETKTETK